MTDVVRLASGAESRNARWARSRRRWEVGGATIRSDLAHELVTFFEARRGRLYGFRFRDPVDWKSCPPSQAISALDQAIGLGDGEMRSFQLIKRYASGTAWTERRIEKPVEGTVVMTVNGLETTEFEVDAMSGLATFDVAPADGAVLTAGVAFDVPVRFDADQINVALAGHDAARVLRVPLVEISG